MNKTTWQDIREEFLNSEEHFCYICSGSEIFREFWENAHYRKLIREKAEQFLETINNKEITVGFELLFRMTESCLEDPRQLRLKFLDYCVENTQ